MMASTNHSPISLLSTNQRQASVSLTNQSAASVSLTNQSAASVSLTNQSAASVSLINHGLMSTSRDPASTSTSSHVTVVWPQTIIGPPPKVIKLNTSHSGSHGNSTELIAKGNLVATKQKASAKTKPVPVLENPLKIASNRLVCTGSNVTKKYMMMKQEVRHRCAKIFVVNPADLMQVNQDSSLHSEQHRKVMDHGRQTQTLNTVNYTKIAPKGDITSGTRLNTLEENMPLEAEVHRMKPNCRPLVDGSALGSVALSSDLPDSDDNVLMYTGSDQNEINVKVEPVNPPLGDFGASEHQFHSSNENLDVMTSAPLCAVHSEDQEFTPDSYGPEFIIEEAEVIAAETGTMPTADMLVSMDMSLEGVVPGSSQTVDDSDDMVLSSVAMVTQELEGNGHGHRLEIVRMPCNQNSLTVSNTEQHLSEANLVTAALNSDDLHAMISANQSHAWMKREWKKARDRAKKRSKRADPAYRHKEREEAQRRMRSRRMDPDYREKERDRDRQRRKLARQQNTSQRLVERERDKMYRRLRRTSFVPDPHLMLTIGEMTSQFVDVDDVDSHDVPETELGGEVAVMDTNVLDFQVDDGSVIPVYNELEVRSEHSVDDYG